MVIRVFLTAVEVEEADHWPLPLVNGIARCQGERLGLPVVHARVVAFGVGHTIMAPPIDWRRPRLEALKGPLSRLLVLEIEGQSL